MNEVYADTDLTEVIRTVTAGCDVVVSVTERSEALADSVATELDVPAGLLTAELVTVDRDGRVSLGAVASDGSAWIDDASVNRYAVTRGELNAAVVDAQQRALETISRYEQRATQPSLREKDVFVVDDGESDAAIVLACLRTTRAARANTVVFVTAADRPTRPFRAEADAVVCIDRGPGSSQVVGPNDRSEA